MQVLERALQQEHAENSLLQRQVEGYQVQVQALTRERDALTARLRRLNTVSMYGYCDVAEQTIKSMKLPHNNMHAIDTHHFTHHNAGLLHLHSMAN